MPGALGSGGAETAGAASNTRAGNRRDPGAAPFGHAAINIDRIKGNEPPVEKMRPRSTPRLMLMMPQWPRVVCAIMSSRRHSEQLLRAAGNSELSSWQVRQLQWLAWSSCGSPGKDVRACAPANASNLPATLKFQCAKRTGLYYSGRINPCLS